MSHDQYNINFISRILKNNNFEYNGTLFNPSYSVKEMFGGINYVVDKILDIKKKIVIGDWKPIIYLNISIVGGDVDYINRLKQIKTVLDDEQFNGIIKMFSAQMISEIREDLRNFLHSRIGFDGVVNVENINVVTEEVNNLFESKSHSLPIRTIIKDIVNVLKKHGEGDYSLPEDIDGNMIYQFERGPENISIDLTIRFDDDVKTFIVNGNYVKNEDVIEVLVVLNPEKELKGMMYDIIGDLNDLIAHELEHYNQYMVGEYDLDDNDDKSEESLQYYTKPHEIKAQIKGFKRLSKIRRIPLETTIRNWFDTHQDIHLLNKSDAETVINTLLQHV